MEDPIYLLAESAEYKKRRVIIMADRFDKYEDNIGGVVEIEGKKYSFYVDRECIYCHVCAQAAPDNFRHSDEDDHDICYKQPQNEIELEQCYEALQQCPVEAIGDDDYD